MKKSQSSWNFDNTYQKLPNILFKKIIPEKLANPQKVFYNNKLSSIIGLPKFRDNDMAEYFSGSKIVKDSINISQAYSGHQFGYYTNLGDGRAVLIGEVLSPCGVRYDIQLKGIGKTPYSRRGDGRATLSSVLREYLMSEAIFHLKIPTTRSLAVIKTGKKVQRDQSYDGAVLARVASSHIRFGTFEFVRNNCSTNEIKIFTEYVINRHFPLLKHSNNKYVEFFKIIFNSQIDLIIDWMRVGFIHGVMNTDNMTISGETIDYGPCSFMNTFDPNTVFSSIDSNGRYSFMNQAKALNWNLLVFANTIKILFEENDSGSFHEIELMLENYQKIFSNKWYKMMSLKLGIKEYNKNNKILIDKLYYLMLKYNADYTNTFKALSSNTDLNNELFRANDFMIWKNDWKRNVQFEKNKLNILHTMKNYNPSVIPRNHLVEDALGKAIKNDLSDYKKLLNLIHKPYDYSTDLKFQSVPDGYDKTYKTFCGT